jgi:hypothetical protein
MVIIRINGIFTLLLPATCFGSIRAIFRLKYYLLKKVIYTVVNIVVDCIHSAV